MPKKDANIFFAILGVILVGIGLHQITKKKDNPAEKEKNGMGLSDWFSKFCSNLQVRDGGTISYRYKRITRQLNTDFWNATSETSHSLYVGSYGRNTAIEAIRGRNAACNNNLVPLCRMMRAWRREWNVPIGGLLIDTLAYQFIENYEYRNKSYWYYDYLCRDFFKWMADQNAEQEYLSFTRFSGTPKPSD